MFDQTAKKLLGTRYRFGQRLPIMKVSALVADDRYRHYLAELKILSDLPDEHFRIFYRHALEQFIEFVQLFPGEESAPLGHLLETGLLQAINVLYSFVASLGSDASPAERYALFTAYLCRDLGQVVTRQKVLITNPEGCTVKIWQPFSGPLTQELTREENGDSYKMVLLATVYESIHPKIKLTLARQTIGEAGFAWISSDLDLLKEWLEAFDETDEGGVGRLVCAIKRYRQEGKHFMELPLVTTDLPFLESPATKHADALYAWLIEGLANKTIKVNTANAFVHITSKGVFLHTPEVVKTFVKDRYQGRISEAVVTKQLDHLLGITATKGNKSYMHTQVSSKYSPDFANLSATNAKRFNIMLHGLLIKEAHSLYLHSKMPEISTHVKLAAAIKKEHEALAEFNESIKPSLTMKK